MEPFKIRTGGKNLCLTCKKKCKQTGGEVMVLVCPDYIKKTMKDVTYDDVIIEQEKEEI